MPKSSAALLRSGDVPFKPAVVPSFGASRLASAEDEFKIIGDMEAMQKMVSFSSKRYLLVLAAWTVALVGAADNSKGTQSTLMCRALAIADKLSVGSKS